MSRVQFFAGTRLEGRIFGRTDGGVGRFEGPANSVQGPERERGIRRGVHDPIAGHQSRKTPKSKANHIR